MQAIMPSQKWFYLDQLVSSDVEWHKVMDIIDAMNRKLKQILDFKFSSDMQNDFSS
jgi:hypothetical protein